MGEFRFAQLASIHLLWIVLVLSAVLVGLELRRRSALDQMVSRLMQNRLVYRSSLARRLVGIGLVTAALIALTLAMMRPQWGRTVQAVTRVDSQIMVCLDVSRSMLAEDVAPNRLDRAKAELESLLGLMDEGQQVGLIAFAGKASVLCPMTSDFGFLRLVIREAQPGSVGLGGTKIGEALRKAVDGFRISGDVNRLILLITDGEDHDSFPLDAAKAARERGIRIVSVGFGDEAGSKIEITDPKTHVRSFVQDRSGNDVISRLDGETLREVALETEGAYIPAGTGALDLESIYSAHIATLLEGTVDDRQHVVRHEAYQWCVLAATILCVLGLVAGTPLRLRSKAIDASSDLVAGPVAPSVLLAFALVATELSVGVAAPSGAAAVEGPAGRAAADGSGAAKKAVASSAEEPSASPPGRQDFAEMADTEEELTARESYNRALAYLSGDSDRAERLLNRARRDAGVDGEVRFRSLYNLGWVEVHRADAVVKEQPAEAIKHLEQAANRFRESIRVRPDSTDARHNLEIISRRILELTDALAKTDPRNLESRLDDLIQRQRDHRAELQTVVEQSGAERPNAADRSSRRSFRRLGVVQRQVIADMQRFADDARGETESLKQKQDEKSPPADRLRLVQLENMLRFVERSLQRMQKARGLARRMQGERAFARWSAALTDAKRARDQLRHPVEVLGVILQDATELARLTGAMAAARSDLTTEAKQLEAPAWLTREYLLETQTSTTERTGELTSVLASAVSPRGEAGQDQDSDDVDAPADDAKTERLLANIREALPLMKTAGEEFADAGADIEEGNYRSGLENQAQALVALADAWELFCDVRRLIEMIHRQQQLVRGTIDAIGEKPALAGDLSRAAVEAQKKNLARCRRLDEMFDLELEQLERAKQKQDDDDQAAADQQSSDVQQQRYQTAKEILVQAVRHATGARRALEQSGRCANDSSLDQTAPDRPADKAEQAGSPESDGGEEDEVATDDDPETKGERRSEEPDESGKLVERAAVEVDRSLERIEELRRLFFSLVEHLRDTAQRQVQLNDDTSSVRAEQEKQTPEKIGPLAGRQQQLQAVADQIGQALRRQADEAASAPQRQPQQQPGRPPGHPDPQQAAKAAETLGKAGELVDESQASMKRAAGQLELTEDRSPDKVDFESVAEEQQTALEKLAAALALLDQPRQNNSDNQSGQDQQQQQDQQQSDEEDSKQQQAQPESQSASQLLQMIRDREAQRRKDKRQVGQVPGGQVEKDW